MSVKFANNAFGTLNAGINNSATSLTLSSGQGARFPTLASGEYFYATLIDTSNNLEVVKCTARSTDVLTITRAQESTTAQAFAIGDRVELRVTAQGLDDAANPYDKDTSSTGSLALPVGTTAQQPTAADTEGHIRYDSDDSVVYYSNGTDWLKISSVIATLSSASGNIFTGTASTLTLAGKGFQSANLVVNFTQSSDSINEDVSVTPTSDTAATVAVPAAVYNNVTSGNVVSISVTNADGIASAAVTKTAVATPSGGTVTTSGGYRIHTFTSSGTFTNTIASNAVEYLVVAGGGGGGGGTKAPNATANTGGGGGGGGPHGPGGSGGGGGGGGFRTNVSGATSGRNSSAESSMSLSVASFAVTVGGGGGGGSNSGGTAGSSSSFNSISSNGGGAGGSYTGGIATSGGCGGGGDSAPTNARLGKSGTSGQGFDGGDGWSGYSSPYSGGGGGGAGANGGDGSSSVGGDGGAGLQSSITGSATYYAGGGGGGGNSSSSNGSGGAGGGSDGATGLNPDSGDNNGGSGIVIIRYQL